MMFCAVFVGTALCSVTVMSHVVQSAHVCSRPRPQGSGVKQDVSHCQKQIRFIMHFSLDGVLVVTDSEGFNCLSFATDPTATDPTFNLK